MYSNDFVLVANFRHFFYIYKKSQATWSRDFLGNFPKKKNHNVLTKKVMKLPKIFGGFGWLSSFEIVLLGSSGSPTCKKIPQFFKKNLFVL
jgi:hypothetical protein